MGPTTFIDTATNYGTEGVVGRALKTIPRDSVVIATKTQFRGKEWRTPQQVVASLDDSLRLMGTDHVDVFNLHGVELPEYDYALNVIAPALLEEKRKGKIRSRAGCLGYPQSKDRGPIEASQLCPTPRRPARYPQSKDRGPIEASC